LTACSTWEEEAAARAAGCSGWISKPIDPYGFSRDVRQFLHTGATVEISDM
jgi:hypothetical protein